MSPSLQDVVKLLQSERLEPVGFGVRDTQDSECNCGKPYVVISVRHASLLDYHANRVKYALQRNGIEPTPVGDDGVSIRGIVDPVNDLAVVEVIGLTDDLLPQTS